MAQCVESSIPVFRELFTSAGGTFISGGGGRGGGAGLWVDDSMRF